VYWSFDADGLHMKAFKNAINGMQKSILTKRELEVLVELENDLTNSQIAKNLFISAHNVAIHRKHIFKKTNCHNVADRVRFKKKVL